MNYGISILFRAIPLLMALFCFRLRSLCARHGDGHEPIRCGARGLLFRNDMYRAIRHGRYHHPADYPHV